MKGRSRKVLQLPARQQAFLVGHGFRLLDDVVPAYCEGGCGPIWLPVTWPGADADWRVSRCCWCSLRSRVNKLQRPGVDCASCRHYRAEPVRDGKGWCTLRAIPRLPQQKRQCGFWKPPHGEQP